MIGPASLEGVPEGTLDRIIDSTALGDFHFGEFHKRDDIIGACKKIVAGQVTVGTTASAPLNAALTGRITGDPELIEAARETAEYLVDSAGLNIHQINIHLALLVVAIESSDVTLAKNSLEQLSALPKAAPGSPLVNVDRLMGLGYATVGDAVAAEASFRSALDWCRTNGSIPENAWTCSDFAEFLIARDDPGDRELASELQDEAIAIA